MYLGWDIGIKHLAYSLLEYKNKKINIVEWGIIDLLEDHDPTKYCSKLTAKQTACGCKATHIQINLEENKYVCSRHAKGMDKNLLEVLPSKIICSHTKCKSIATFHDHVNKKHYCGKHNKDIPLENLDKITQTTASKMPLYTLAKMLYRKLDKHPSLLSAKYICLENQPSTKNPTMKSIQMILYSYFVMKVNEGKLVLRDLIMMSAKNKLKLYKNEYGELPSEITNHKDRYQKNKKSAVFITSKYLEHEHEEKWQDFYKNNKSKKDDLADAYLMCKFYIHRIQKL